MTSLLETVEVAESQPPLPPPPRGKSLREMLETKRRECLVALLGETGLEDGRLPHPWQLSAEMEDEVVVIGTAKDKNGEGNSGGNAPGTGNVSTSASVPVGLPFASLTVQWLMNNYQTDRNGSIPRSTVYFHYIEHCKQHNLEPLNAASFGKLIRSVFLRIETRRLGTRGKSRYHYSGLILKPTSKLRYIDVNELPSYYGHPSRTSMVHQPNFQNVVLKVTKNIPRNTYRVRAPNHSKPVVRPQTGRLREIFAKKRLEALKEYFQRFENGPPPEDFINAANAANAEEMEEQFVVLDALDKTDVTVDTMSSLNPRNFHFKASNLPKVHASPKRPMQFSSLTVQWLMSNFKTDKSGSIPRSAVYFHYMEHCTSHGLEPLNAASFGKLIRSVFLGIETRRLGTRGKSRYHYSGLVLKPTSTLTFLDLSDLPSYYGHPSGISAQESQNFHMNYTKMTQNLSLIETGEPGTP